MSKRIFTIGLSRVHTQIKIAALLVALSICALPALAKEIPLEHFAKHGDYLELKISPDGKHMAGRIRLENSVLLYVLDTNSLEVVGGVKPPKGSEIHSVTWVNNDRLVYEFAQKFARLYDEPVATGELFGVNVDGSKSVQLYGFRASNKETGRRLFTKESSNASQQIVSLLEDDPDNILIAEYPWTKKSIPVLSKLNVYNGIKKKIERVPFPQANILSDKKGNVRFVSWFDEDNKVNAASRASAKAEWEKLTLSASSNNSGHPVQINDAGTKVYWRAKLGTEKLESLLEQDLITGEFKTLFTNEVADLSHWESDLDSHEPVVGVFYPDTAAFQYTNTASDMVVAHKQLERAFKGQDIFITSHTKDGNKMLVNVASDINPGEFYLFDRTSKQVDFIWANRSWIDPRDMTPTQNITIKARDGVDIRGLLTVPDSSESTPLVVIPHGGPHGVRDHWEFNPEVQFLANRGYSVLQVNFRGSGGYGEQFEEMGYQNWGTTMIDDIIDATQSAISSHSIDKDKVCIYGASYGAYAAMMAAAKAPSLYQCAVGSIGVYDLTLMYSDGDIPSYWGGEAYLKKVLGEDEAMLKANSPTSRAKDITANVMLIHGTADRRAPIKHAIKMRSALKSAGNEPEWVKYGDTGHGVWDEEKRLDLYAKLLGFFDQHLNIDRASEQ